MNLRPLLASAALTFATVAVGADALPAGAGAASTVQLRFANSSSYNFPSGNTFGFCVDGSFIGVAAPGAVSVPVSVAPGDHDIVILYSDSQNCSDLIYEAKGTYSVPDVVSATHILNNRNALDGDPLQVLPDDLSCPAAGEGRLVVRNGSQVGFRSNGSVDFFAETGSTDPVALLQDVSLMGQDSTNLTPGTYEKARAGATGGTYQDAAEVPPSAFDIQAGKVTFVFLAGGWDGSPGLYTETLDANCATTPTTPTTAPTTTVPVTVAPAAVPVATQPTYTG